MHEKAIRDLRRRLLRGGVAPKHVNRTIKELRHHFTDLEQKALNEGIPPNEAAAQALEQLGDIGLLIKEALSRPELKSWAHRLPWGVYGLFPVMVFVLVAISSILAVVAVLDWAESASGLTPAAFANALVDRAWAVALLEGWRVFMMYALPLVLAGGLCLFAAWREAPVIWPTVGVVLILLLGFSFDVHFSPPEGPDQTGTLGAGVGWSAEYFLSLRVFRLLIPLFFVLGPFYWWCRIQQQRHRG